MKCTYLLLFVFFTVSAIAQTSLYEHPDFDRIARRHKIIAILPFDATVTLRPKDMKDMTEEQLDRMEKAEGESIQNGMYAWFLKRSKKGTMTVKIQDPRTTNATLLKEGISVENMEEYTLADLAKILEVDAIISGTFETTKPMSEGASAALGVLIGFWGSTNKATINLNIHNGEDGDLLINYHKAVRGSIGSSTDDLINKLMRKSSRRISYTK